MRRAGLFVFAAALMTPAVGAAVALGPCPDPEDTGAKCGELSVFEDRAAGAGRKIDIHFMLLRATGETPRAEPIVLLAGGPGQGGTELSDIARGQLADLREYRDFLMIDQRGTGRSRPLDCSPEGADENPQVVFGNVFDPVVVESCRSRLEREADLRLYTTSLAVADLDDIRHHLGYERLLLWGSSYGSRFAMEYMRRHPDRVLAATLDGVAAFDLKAPLY